MADGTDGGRARAGGSPLRAGGCLPVALVRGHPVRGFGDAAAGADEPPPVFFINPLRQRRALRLLGTVMRVIAMFALCRLRAAVFTEPAITQIEEVGRLVHRAAFYIRSAPRVRRFHQTHRHGHSPAVSPDLNLNSFADLMFVQYSEQVV